MPAVIITTPIPPVIRGVMQAAIVQGKVSSNFSRTKGASTTIEYHGTQNQVISNALVFQSYDGWETTIDNPLSQGGGSWKLTATYPEDLLTGNPSTPAPVWTIEPHALERNVLECTDRAFIADLTTEIKNRIEYVLKVPTTKTDLFPSGSTVNQKLHAQTAYNLMRVGVEGRQEFTIAVKRTLIVSRLVNVQWALVNNNRVLSKSFLVSDYFVDNATALFMPQSSGVTTDTNGIATMFGYLENRPTRQTLANNKVQLEQQWVYNKWSVGPN